MSKKKSSTATIFGEDYWDQAKEKYAQRNKPLIPYKQINQELKELKNEIGKEILKYVERTNSDIMNCEEVEIGKVQSDQLYQRIEAMLEKLLVSYNEDCDKLSKQIQLLLEENLSIGSIEEFFDNEIWNLDKIEDFIEHFEVNMYASYHLMKKLDRQTQQVNLKILENFLEREVKNEEESAYIKLARASKVGALMEGFRLKIQLLELNKELIIKSKITGSNKAKEKERFVEMMNEFKEEFLQIEKRYKQHQNLWLRCSTTLNKVEFYDSEFEKETQRLNKGILKSWKKAFKNSNLEIPDSLDDSNKTGKKQKEKKKESASYNDYSAWLVIIHTMIYKLIYYGNAPTASSYSKAIDFPESLTGIVQAATPFSGIFSAFHYSRVIENSYKGGYVVSFSCMILGNFLYYISKTFNSVILIIIGRFVLGYSGARVIPRNFVATKIKRKYRTLWSSYMVAFSALSATLGPGISSLLEFIPETTILGTELRNYNSFSFIFFIVSTLYCILFFITFTDMPGSPSNNKQSKKKKKATEKEKKKEKKKENKLLKEGERIRINSDFTKMSLKSFKNSEFIKGEKKEIVSHDDDENLEGIRVLNNTKIVKQYFPVYFILVAFICCKMIQESIITEIPLTVKNFYGFSSQDTGFLLLSFTPLTLSMSLLPGYLALVKKFKNINMMLFFFSCLFITLCLKINLNYDSAQPKIYYMIVTCLSLSFTFATEVSMTAMFGKITPYYIVQSFWNAGLLSGMFDSLGRTLGNSSVSFFNSIEGITYLTFWMYSAWIFVLLIFILIALANMKSIRIIWRVKIDLKGVRKSKNVKLETKGIIGNSDGQGKL